MPASRADDVAVLAALLRRTGAIVECAVAGESMGTAAPDGALVRIRCEGMAGVAVGSVVATMIGGRLSVHRVVHIGRSRSARGWLITHGDANLTCDAPLPEAAVVGLLEERGRIRGARVRRGAREHGDDVAADLVVDTTGRMGHGQRWLEALGWPASAAAQVVSRSMEDERFGPNTLS